MELNWAERWVVNNPSRILQQRIEMMLLRKAAPLHAGATILEAGCGRGAGARLILDTFQPATLIASDVDVNMIRRARRYLPHYAANRIVFSVDNLRRLPYRSEALDAVFLFGVLHHVPDWQGALSEIVRVLKPDGFLIFEEIYPSVYQNVLTRHILLHPQTNRFRSDDLRKELKKARLSLLKHWEVKKIGILGIARKTVSL
jgi:ubiquinone/menaquinone biosynthesis C-methylase UbiE